MTAGFVCGHISHAARRHGAALAALMRETFACPAT